MQFFKRKNELRPSVFLSKNKDGSYSFEDKIAWTKKKKVSKKFFENYAMEHKLEEVIFTNKYWATKQIVAI